MEMASLSETQCLVNSAVSAGGGASVSVVGEQSGDESSSSVYGTTVLHDSMALCPVASDSSDDTEGGFTADDPNRQLVQRTIDTTGLHSTTNTQALMHLMKGNIGTGIMALPSAFKYGGLWLGFIGIFVIGSIAVHCMHILVNCAQYMRIRTGVSSFDYGELMKESFSLGPPLIQRLANAARNTVNVFLCITQFGFCTVYVLFVADNIRQVIEAYTSLHVYFWLYQLAIFLLLLPYVAIRHLKKLAPFSMLANLLTVVGLAITLFYCFSDLPSVYDRPAIASLSTLPLYFGIAIFTFEGIGVVLPVENKMKTPQAFGGWFGVIDLAMTIAMVLYAAVGFYGYLRFGDAVQGSITLNLPCHEGLYAAVKVMFATAIYITYGIQFYVPIEILWPSLQQLFSTSNWLVEHGEYLLRYFFLFVTFLLASTIPHLDLMISLVGTLSSSAIALIFPPMLEIVTYWHEPHRYGHYRWRVGKDILIMLLGILGFFIGTITTLINIAHAFSERPEREPC